MSKHNIDMATQALLTSQAMELQTLRARVKELSEELERERMRLAACGAAALGYFNGCADEYKSASLDDVLRLREQLAACEAAKAEQLSNAMAQVARVEKQARDAVAEKDAIWHSYQDCRNELAAMTKERDAAIKEAGKWSREAGYSQAREQQLREALETLHPPGAITEFESLILEPLFTIPHDTSALLHASHEESLRQDAMVKDAARYRWICDHGVHGLEQATIGQYMTMDSAIDAAMTEVKE